MKARLRTLAVLLIMGVCLMGDFVITRQVQASGLSSSQTLRQRTYRRRLARWRMISYRRHARANMLRRRQRLILINRRRRMSLYNRRHYPRAWSIWARRHRRRGRGRNWTPGIPRGRARGWHRKHDYNHFVIPARERQD